MNVALWVGQILLASIGLAGLFKAVAPKATVRAKFGPWVDDFPGWGVKGIGLSEFLAMLGLILPPLLGIATFLTPLAAVGLALMMIGAAIVHLRHREYQSLPVNAVLFAIAVFVAWGRFGPYAF